MGGGGGVSGEVKFPPYLQDKHDPWLGTPQAGSGVFSRLSTDFTNLPLSTSFTNPTSDMSDLETFFLFLKNKLSTNSWDGSAIVNNALNDANTTFYQTLINKLDQQSGYALDSRQALDDYIDVAIAKMRSQIAGTVTVESLDPLNDWEDILQKAQPGVDGADILSTFETITRDDNETSDIAAATTKAGTMLSVARGLIFALSSFWDDEDDVWENLMDSVVAKMDEQGVMPSIDTTNTMNEAKDKISQALTAARQALIDATPSTEDWSGFVDTVVAKLAEQGIITDLSITQAIANANAQVTTQMDAAFAAFAPVINRGEDFSTNIDSLLNEISTNATLLEDVDFQQEGESKSITDAIALVEAALQAIPTDLYDPQTEWAEYFDTVVAKLAEQGSLHDTDIDGANTAAQSAADAMWAKVQDVSYDSGIDPDTDVGNYIVAAGAAVDNILQSLGVSGILNSANNNHAALVAGILQLIDTGLDENSDWADMVNGVLTQLSTVPGTLKEVDLTGAINDAIGRTNSQLATAFTQKDNTDFGITPTTDFNALLSAAQSKVDDVGILKTLDIGSILSNAATTISNNIINQLDNVSLENTDWEAFVVSVVDKADTLNVLKDVDITTVVTAAQSGATDEIAAAVVSAINAVNSDVISALVAEHKDEIFDNRTEAIRRFSAGMADVNAVHSSTYLLGVALLERAWLRDVDKFSADLKAQTYNTALQAHVDAYKAQLSAEVQGQIQEKINRDQFVLQNLQILTQILVNKAQFQQAILNLYEQAFQHRANTEYDARKTEKLSREQLLALTSQGMLSIYGQDIAFKQTFVQVYAQAFAGNLVADIEQRTGSKTARDRFVLESVGTITNQLLNRTGFEQSLVQQSVSAWGQILSTEFQAALAEKQSRDQMIAQALQNMVTLLQTKAQVEPSIMGHYKDLQLGALQQYAQGAVVDKTSRDSIINDAVNSIRGLLEAKNRYEETIIRAFTDAYAPGVEPELQAAIVNKQAKDRFILESLGHLKDMQQNKHQYEQAWMGLHSQIWSDRLQQELETGKINKGSREQLLLQGLNSLTQTEINRRQVDQSFLSMYMQGYINHFLGLVEADAKTGDWRVGVMNSGVGAMTSIHEANQQYDQGLIATHSENARSFFNVVTQARIALQQERKELVQQAVDSMVQMINNKSQYERDFLSLHWQGMQSFMDARRNDYGWEQSAKLISRNEIVDRIINTKFTAAEVQRNTTSLMAEIKRLKLVLDAEYDAAVNDATLRNRLWPWTLIGHTSNAMGALTGAAAPLPEKPSRASSVLGGALGGASLGSGLGPPGTVAGAVLGGLAGFLSG